MPVALGDVVNVDHECGIGVNNCGEWSGAALETTPYSLTEDLTHSAQGSQYMGSRMSIKPDGSSTQCRERDRFTMSPCRFRIRMIYTGVEFKSWLVYIEVAEAYPLNVPHSHPLAHREELHTEVGEPILQSVLSKSHTFYTLTRPVVSLLPSGGRRYPACRLSVITAGFHRRPHPLR